MKRIAVLLVFFIFSISAFALTVSSSTYNGSVKTVYYTDGSSATFTPTKSKDTWAADNVTKTTTYTYADKTTYALTSTVEPTVVKTIKGLVQTTTTTYGNKKKTATSNTGVLVDGSQSVASNYSSKSGTYRFSDGSTSVISTTVSGSPKVTWATDNVTKTTTYKYADKTTYAVTSTLEPTVSVTWKADHISKSSKYVYGNGKTSTVIQTVNPVQTKSYSAGIQSIATTYGDGYVTNTTNTATSSPVSWASDHITKTITYNFADGTSNPVVSTVAPSVSTPSLTAAVYPSNWTSTGTVTPPRVSSLATTYGDGYVSTSENGTFSKPFNQTTLSAQSITDSSGYVTSSTTTYNLTWGTPDKDGPSYAAAFNQGASSYTYPSPINIWGNRVAGYNLATGPTYAAPHQDVISAWNQGWTGKGINLVIADFLMTNHGVITASLAGRYAYAANMYGIPLDSDMYTTTTNVFNTNGNYANLNNIINVGAINLSFGANYSYGTTAPARAIVDNASSSLRNNWVNILKGTDGYIYQGLNMTDAVVIKSAGNDAISADKESFVKAYADDAAIKNRLLIAGALSYTLDGKGYIASYSNTAGDDTNVSGRFLVASGGTPFSYGDISINGTLANSSEFGSVGTSFAAPRVAGYVAIVRSKFPNLDAIKTSAIMLDTARYDTLSCYPSCSPSIYGAGEASLSRALAPIGRLR
jgi:hypothetical protein